MSDEDGGVFITLPLPDERVFRYQAANDILELLYRNPHREFSITELRGTTGHGGKSVDNAVRILDSLGLVNKERRGRHSLVGIRQERLRKPDDPLLEIPQGEFREPLKEFLERTRERQGNNLVGVVVFGSVARGEADRASDVDVQVIVEDDLVEARRELQDARQEVEDRKFDGNRYEIQLLVESADSARNHGEKLREIFAQGVVLHSSEALDRVKEAVFHGE